MRQPQNQLRKGLSDRALFFPKPPTGGNIMRHISLDCPNCNAVEKAVGNPNEANHGWDGKWYCFYCGSSGTYVMEFVVIKGRDPEA